MVEMENSPPMTVSTGSGEASQSSSGNQFQLAPPKKKRNHPGMPDPDADVIALSPKSLMTKNRFVCEICKKGFQRDQNLQLHRRGHNLPWKLRQRTSNEIRKRVYVCPEPSCPHHDPSRALGDLTGIKKHYCRKHGEKIWKCEKCSKKYAVQSDLKAHMKSCGTKEYNCDCGTIFSRRDSFVTHRAFCNALAEESAKTKKLWTKNCGGDLENGDTNTDTAVASPPPLTPSSVVSPGPSIQSSDEPDSSLGVTAATPAVVAPSSTSSGSILASIFATEQQHKMLPPQRSATAFEPASLSLSTPLYLSGNVASLYPHPENENHLHYAHPPAAISATALLQKAAQIGATTSKLSNQSLLHGFGLEMSPASSPGSMANVKLESNTMPDHLGLGLSSIGSTFELRDSMLGSSSSLFVNKPTTLDLLGLGIGAAGDATSTGLSALFSSFGGGGFAAAAAYRGGGAWEGAPEGKDNGQDML